MDDKVQHYIDQLKRGQTLLYPTDTIWGIGCDATNLSSVERIYEIKKRDRNKPFVLLLSNIEQLNRYTIGIHPRIENLLLYYTKPITIIYQASDLLHPAILNGDGTIAIRITRNNFCKELIDGMNRPLVSTSANLQGEPFPDSFEAISDEILREVDIVADENFESSVKSAPSILVKISEEGELIFLRS